MGAKLGADKNNVSVHGGNSHLNIHDQPNGEFQSSFTEGKNRSLFPDDTSALKLLYLATQEVLKKWTIRTRDWSKILAQLSIHFEDRLTKYL